MRLIRYRGDHNILTVVGSMALAIFLSSMVGLNIFFSMTNGFVIAADVVVFSTILYLYKDIWVMDVTLLTIIASPVLRMLLLHSTGESMAQSALQALPDAAFFLAFGTVYSFMLSYVSRREIDRANFCITIFLSDFIGNITELLVRSGIADHFVYSEKLVGFAMLAAALRTALAFIIISVIEWYSENRLRDEKLREYQTLVTNATTIQDEIHIMNKNSADVEDVVKRGYELYNRLDEEGYPEDLTMQALELAKLAHEIKGDYRNVITVLDGLYRLDEPDKKLTLREIIRIEMENAIALAENRGYDIKFSSAIDEDIVIEDKYKIMSVIRNLLTNSTEALGEESEIKYKDRNKEIHISAATQINETGGRLCVIDIADNGPGIPVDRRDKIFKEGYSTKYDDRTGYIQRGMGLPIVRMYVEHDMHGSIELLDDAPGAHFRIVIPLDEGDDAAERRILPI